MGDLNSTEIENIRRSKHAEKMHMLNNKWLSSKANIENLETERLGLNLTDALDAIQRQGTGGKATEARREATSRARRLQKIAEEVRDARNDIATIHSEMERLQRADEEAAKAYDKERLGALSGDSKKKAGPKRPMKRAKYPTKRADVHTTDGLFSHESEREAVDRIVGELRTDNDVPPTQTDPTLATPARAWSDSSPGQHDTQQGYALQSVHSPGGAFDDPLNVSAATWGAVPSPWDTLDGTPQGMHGDGYYLGVRGPTEERPYADLHSLHIRDMPEDPHPLTVRQQVHDAGSAHLSTHTVPYGDLIEGLFDLYAGHSYPVPIDSHHQGSNPRYGHNPAEGLDRKQSDNIAPEVSHPLSLNAPDEGADDFMQWILKDEQ
jgi:hypothetical protein